MQEQEYTYKNLNHGVNLNDMRVKNKGCDVTIMVNERKIRAHKVILAAYLKYFESKLSSDSLKGNKEDIITVESVDGANLEVFVSYAYTGEILITNSNALGLLEVANYLSEDGIKEACIEFSKKHLIAKEACRAYKLADTIKCLSLKNAAKSKIVSNFGVCSSTTGFLDFDYESLTDILSDGKTQSVESQQILFEGIMRWTMHDASNRKIRMKDLLSYIDITKFPAEYLLDYLGNITAYRNDEYNDIIKDITFLYHTGKIQRKKQGHVLMIVGKIKKKNCSQYYDFIEKKWSQPREIEDDTGNIFYPSAVVNDKLYYINRDPEERDHLKAFDLTTKQSTTLHSSSPILGGVAICACSRLLYLFGGDERVSNPSDQVLRYNPHTKSLETLTPLATKRWWAAAIFYQGCLHVLGGYDGSSDLVSVEKYDEETKRWTAFPSMCEKRLWPAVAVLDGKLYACGGWDGNAKNSVEVYDPSTKCWRRAASMNKPRRYFLLVVYEGKLLAVGGDTENTVEVYDPSENQWQIDREMSSGLRMKYCKGGLISSSYITNDN